MPEITPVAKDDPLMITWERYEATEDYENTRRWALHEQYVAGSLWAVFEAGYRVAEDQDTLRAENAQLKSDFESFVEHHKATERENACLKRLRAGGNRE